GEGNGEGRRQDAADREPPGEQIEALTRRSSEDPRPEVGDERALDLRLRLAASDALTDLDANPLSRGRVRLVESRLADGAHHLALEACQRGARTIAGGRRRRGDGERKRDPGQELHRFSASSSARSNAPTLSPLSTAA